MAQLLLDMKFLLYKIKVWRMLLEIFQWLHFICIWSPLVSYCLVSRNISFINHQGILPLEDHFAIWLSCPVIIVLFILALFSLVFPLVHHKYRRSQRNWLEQTALFLYCTLTIVTDVSVSVRLSVLTKGDSWTKRWDFWVHLWPQKYINRLDLRRFFVKMYIW